MSGHTEGEWGYDKRRGSVYGPPGWIASVQHDRKGDSDFGDIDADGQLLAAAPALLAACKALLECTAIRRYGRCWQYEQQARDAIARAEEEA